MTPSRKKSILNAFWFVLTLVFAAIVFFPYYWMFVSSVETESIFTWPPNLIPSGFSLDSYWTIFEEREIGRWLLNTFIVAGSTSLFSTIIAINAAYACRASRPGPRRSSRSSSCSRNCCPQH
jgi:multiple sugar transport system permease protein